MRPELKLLLELTDLWFSSAEAVNVIITLKKLTTRLGKQNVACRTPPGSAYRGSSIFVVKPATFATYLSMDWRNLLLQENTRANAKVSFLNIYQEILAFLLKYKKILRPHSMLSCFWCFLLLVEWPTPIKRNA